MTRDEAYSALGDLIFKGFLTMGMTLNDKYMVFKTINEKEYQLVKVLSGLSDGKGYSMDFNLYFLAYSLLMIDGRYLLEERDAGIKDIYNQFAAMPDKVCARILDELSALRTVAYDATRYVEGFSYGNSSRSAWQVLGGHPANWDEYTGIPGTRRLGLNIHQESWAYINHALDDEEEYSRQFSMAVLITSGSNPKGARQIRSKHDAMMNAAEERRKRLAEVGYIESKKTWKPDGWAAPVETTEELLAELDRQMKGVKDRHDIFMENYMKKMRENAEARAREAQERIEAVRKQFGDRIPDIDGNQRPLTPQETEQLFKERKINSVVRVKSEEATTFEDQERFMKKIGSRVLTARK